MKFVNYTEIPKDSYQKIITNCLNKLKNIDADNRVMVLRFIQNLSKYNQEEQMEIYLNDIKPLLNDEVNSAFTTLYSIKTGRLESICQINEINQAHLSYNDKNHVFDLIPDLCNQEIIVSLSGENN